MKTTHTIIIGDSRKLSLPNRSVHLIVCSPPYWNLKNYGNVIQQIGFFQSYEDYIRDLNKVWSECYRILHYGCYLCVVIGDIFLRAKENNGKYKIKSPETQIIEYCEAIGFDLITKIIWNKITTTKTSGGCSLMGSIYYPRNPRPTMMHEYILIFQKAYLFKSQLPKVDKETKEKSKVDKQLWQKYLRALWNDIVGEKQQDHPASFPIEIPSRLIQMYSFVGETIFDPFLGCGTTIKAGMQLNRNTIGCEINPEYLEIIKKKIGYEEHSPNFEFQIIIN